MSWSNGNVLVVRGTNDVELRCLVQDGFVTLVSDGVVLDPETLAQLAQYLFEGAQELTRDGWPGIVEV